MERVRFPVLMLQILGDAFGEHEKAQITHEKKKAKCQYELHHRHDTNPFCLGGVRMQCPTECARRGGELNYPPTGPWSRW